MCCHSRTASTVADTVHLVCVRPRQFVSQRTGCANTAVKLSCTQLLPAERLTDSFPMVKAWMCQGRLVMSVLSSPSVGVGASSEDHRGDKGGVLAARLHLDTNRRCWRSLNSEQWRACLGVCLLLCTHLFGLLLCIGGTLPAFNCAAFDVKVNSMCYRRAHDLWIFYCYGSGSQLLKRLQEARHKPE